MTIQLRYILGVALAAPVLAASPAHAQVQVQVTAPGVSVMVPPPPTIQFSAPPPLVVVSPGVQVVPDHDEEIFFVDNYYWVRRGGYWYRSPDYRGGWVVHQAGGPRAVVRYKPGSSVTGTHGVARWSPPQARSCRRLVGVVPSWSRPRRPASWSSSRGGGSIAVVGTGATTTSTN